MSKNKSLKVVTFDWLEDSQVGKARKRVTPYLLESKATTAAVAAEARRVEFLLSRK